MLKKSVLLLIFLFYTAAPIDANAAPFISAEKAVLIDQNTGEVLFDKNAHDKAPIASITKIMTAIIALETGVDLTEKVTVSYDATITEGSSIYLKHKERVTLEDLIYGLMLRSGNDAAIAISEQIGGSEEGFVYLMNEKAKWLGMINTNFTNPHGLHDETHYSTAYDMAILMRYAMNNEAFRKVSATKKYLSKNRDYYWHNKNKLLTELYPYCTGGKTGFTKISGRTLVTTAKKGTNNYIAVTLNAPSDWSDHTSLYDWAFTN